MNLKLYIATGGPLGYAPFSGTLASIFACIVLAPFFSIAPFIIRIMFLIAGLVIGWFCVVYALDYFKKPDPSMIVYDEFIGMTCALLFTKITLVTAFFAFIVFRFFDGSKLCGVSFWERLPGAWGVLADDIVAGLYAACFLQGLQWYGLL